MGAKFDSKNSRTIVFSRKHPGARDALEDRHPRSALCDDESQNSLVCFGESYMTHPVSPDVGQRMLEGSPDGIIAKPIQSR
jgi:hypothetical protein